MIIASLILFTLSLCGPLLADPPPTPVPIPDAGIGYFDNHLPPKAPKPDSGQSYQMHQTPAPEATSKSRYIVGGVFGTLVGFGSGKIIQEDSGMGALYMLLEGIAVAGFFAYQDPIARAISGSAFGLTRLVEIADTWIIPNEPPMKLTGRASASPQFTLALRF